MPKRGDVFRLKRRLGFAAKGEAEAVVVVQTDSLTAVLPTLLVVGLDPAEGAFASWPLVVRVSREESGSRVEQVAVPWNLRPISGDALAPGSVGRLRPETLRALEESIRLVLDLS